MTSNPARVNSNQAEPDADKTRGDKIGKKINITLAMDDYIVKEIRKEAENNHQSLNVRINSILRKYIDFYRMVEVNKGIIMDPASFQLYVNEIDEEKLISTMERVATDFVASLQAQRNIPLTLDNIIKFSFEESAVNARVIRNVSRYVDEEDGRTCLFFMHDYGEKWSRVICAAFSHHIESLLHYHTTVKIFSNSVEIKILEKNIQ